MTTNWRKFSICINPQQKYPLANYNQIKHLYYIFIDFVYNLYLPPFVCCFCCFNTNSQFFAFKYIIIVNYTSYYESIYAYLWVFVFYFIFFGNTCSSSFAKLILGCFSFFQFLILPLLKVFFCMSSVYVVVVVAVFNKNHCFKLLFS